MNHLIQTFLSERKTKKSFPNGYSLGGVQKKPKIKTPHLPLEVRQVLASNVKQLLWEKEQWRELTPLEAQTKSGVSYKTVERILKADPEGGGLSVASLHWLAKAFNAEAWELLRPGYRRAPGIAGNESRHNETQGRGILKHYGMRNAQSKDRKSGNT